MIHFPPQISDGWRAWFTLANILGCVAWAYNAFVARRARRKWEMLLKAYHYSQLSNDVIDAKRAKAAEVLDRILDGDPLPPRKPPVPSLLRGPR